MIYTIMMMAVLTDNGLLQDKFAQAAQIQVQPQDTDKGDTRGGGDIIFDDFDIDAPFDERMDIGVDWPELDESNENGEQLADQSSPRQEAISTDKNEQSNIATEPLLGDGNAPNDVMPDQITNDAILANDDNIGGNGDAPIGFGADNEQTSESRQRALEFEDNDTVSEQQVQRDDALVRLGGKQSYSISFSGLEDIDSSRLFARFNALSVLRTNSKETANGSQILRRAKTDIALMERLLRLEGYYDNLVQYRIQNNQLSAPAQADINVILEIVAGPQYRFDKIALPGIEESEDAGFIRDALALSRGDTVQQDAIVDGKIRLQNRLLENGYAFGLVGDPDLLIDHARRAGDLTLSVTPNRKYRFGRIVTSEDSILSGEHLEKIARFDQGDIFKQSNIVDLRQAIFGTSLASSITVNPIPSAANPDEVDLDVELGAAPPRTVAGLFGFNTGEGLRVEASWEHRNFFPPEGAINIAGILGTREQAFGLTFRRNNFQGRDTVLTATFAARNQNLNAFNARSINIGIGYERKTTLIFQKKWTWNAGIEYALSDEEAIFGTAESRELFNILAIPAGVSYDGSDDLLDPRKGFRLSARVAPEFSLGVADIAYFKSQIDGSAYQPVNDRLTLAGRIRLGSITGAQTSSIAPSRRNFSGGGGSVRGFGFQDIGPLDVNGNPTGGRGLAELALEARYRIGSFGIVPFVDAGSISNAAYPDFNDLRFAAGVGLRYYTSFGPVRVDVGTPFNRREGESAVAVAISLGQAF